MSVEVIRSALLWCTAINYGLLALWCVLFALPRGWMYRSWRRWGFRLSDEQFDALNYGGLMLYKMGVLLFNVVPYVALRIVA